MQARSPAREASRRRRPARPRKGLRPLHRPRRLGRDLADAGEPALRGAGRRPFPRHTLRLNERLVLAAVTGDDSAPDVGLRRDVRARHAMHRSIGAPMPPAASACGDQRAARTVFLVQDTCTFGVSGMHNHLEEHERQGTSRGNSCPTLQDTSAARRFAGHRAGPCRAGALALPRPLSTPRTSRAWCSRRRA